MKNIKKFENFANDSIDYSEYIAECIDKDIEKPSWMEEYTESHNHSTSGFSGPTGVSGTAGFAGLTGLSGSSDSSSTGSTWYDGDWSTPSSNTTYVPSTSNVYEQHRTMVPVRLSFIQKIRKIITDWNDI